MVYSSVKNYQNLFPLMLDMSLADSISLVLNIAFNIGLKAAIALLILAILIISINGTSTKKVS